MLDLYRNIRRRRIELGMSQQQLADKLGYKSRSAINKIEMGINDLTQSKIVAFAEALQTTPGELMGWTDPKYRATWRYAVPNDDENKVSFVFPPDDVADDDCPPPSLNQKTYTVFATDGTAGPHTVTVNADKSEKLAELLLVARELPNDKIDMLLKMAESIK